MDERRIIRPKNYQKLLAKCFVTMSEIDYDLRRWETDLYWSRWNVTQALYQEKAKTG